MTKVFDLIQAALPRGSRSTSTGWDTICVWPPDVFAIAATLAERTGIYADPQFTDPADPNFLFTREWRDKVTEAGRAWRTDGKPPDFAQEAWSKLIAERDSDVAVVGTWMAPVMTLMAISDEACLGVGFAPDPGGAVSTPAFMAYEDYEELNRKKPGPNGAMPIGGKHLPNTPISLCQLVLPSFACVQPKTSAPSVGCTLRSLSHNLALLPPSGHVTTHWHIANAAGDDHFNLLVVPYPYRISGQSFVAGHQSPHTGDRFFAVDPSKWLPTNSGTFAEFLRGLIAAAADEVQTVHGIVLPELALTREFADAIASELKSIPNLELLITGMASPEDGGRNLAAIYRFDEADDGGRTVAQASFQSKHHRWCLDEGQIKRYHLGHVLQVTDRGTHARWWERIAVSPRHAYVMLFRPSATLSVLICEDLARYDPVLTVMNAIGPNLVIALLMDGPQLEQRWCGRYATALADDPGSSALTITSLGMLTRSRMPGEPVPREVALWKEPDGQARPLRLGQGEHALVLTLTPRPVEQTTLDGRSDTRAMRLLLTAATGLRHKGQVPAGIDLG